MNETQKNETIVELMEIIAAADRLIGNSEHIELVSFDQLTPELWATICDDQPAIRGFLNLLKTSISLSAKTIDNDAFISHLTAVIEAE